MPDLYLDNVDDQVAFDDASIVDAIQSLIKMGQREGPLLDYKKDISEKDNWAETAAAFANTFGGLIIFGVEAKGDEPCALTGFDPQNVETKTRLASKLLARIQPRPEFQIRTVKLATGKEVAVLRVSEGLRPPYMYSESERHRVYVRVGAQKAEADYLQLSALYDKRAQGASLDTGVLSHVGSHGYFTVHRPSGSNQVSQDWYRFSMVPQDARGKRRLTAHAERTFEECLSGVYAGFAQALRAQNVRRTANTTYCWRPIHDGLEQRFALNESGCVAFVAHACMETNKARFFRIHDFCAEFVRFLRVASSYYDRIGYHGDCSLQVTLAIPDSSIMASTAIDRIGAEVFEPRISTVSGNTTLDYRVSLFPFTTDRISSYLEGMLNDVGRQAGAIVGLDSITKIRNVVADSMAKKGD